MERNKQYFVLVHINIETLLIRVMNQIELKLEIKRN